MRLTLATGIGILALFGLADSGYLMFMHAQSASPQTQVVASACDFAGGACDAALSSSASSFFGIPTAILGGAYFAAVLGIAAIKMATGRWPVPTLLTFFFLGALAFSAYLIYTMVAVLSAICPFCMAAHITSIMIVGAYAVCRWRERCAGR